jgi:(5-formylfuran-3-yl)methyl phosphate synthase
MRLLVSVSGAADVEAAIEGGADIVDAKDATQGALGAVAPSVLRDIIAAASGRRPVSAALGEAPDSTVPMRVAAMQPGEVSFVKLGFAAGVDGRQGRAHARLLAGALATTGAAMVLAAYADAEPDRLGRDAVLEIAAACGAAGVLLDTLGKGGGRSLFALADPDDIAEWVAAAQRQGLFAALAGSIGPDEIALAGDTGADVVGIRGAACDGGRDGRVSAARVRALIREMSVAGGDRPQANGGRATLLTGRREEKGERKGKEEGERRKGKQPQQQQRIAEAGSQACEPSTSAAASTSPG